VDVWCGDVLFILYLYFNTLILVCFGGEGMRDDGDDGWFVWGANGLVRLYKLRIYEDFKLGFFVLSCVILLIRWRLLLCMVGWPTPSSRRGRY